MNDTDQDPVGGETPQPEPETAEGGDRPIIVQGTATPTPPPTPDEPETEDDGGDRPIIVQGS